MLKFIALIALSVLLDVVNSCPDGWFPSLLDINTCYFVSSQPMSWLGAAIYCEYNGGPGSRLTSVLSAFETNLINDVASKNPAIGTTDQVWTGARGVNGDERFIWVDGSQFDYTNWLAGQPNLLYPCVSTLARSGGRWRTEPCDTKNYFICKYAMQPTTMPTDCFDWHFKNGNSTNGIYQIYPPGIPPFNVYCDMVTDGGGWTVFQKRSDNNTVFWNRPWSDYKNGFTDDTMDRNSWLGLDRISVLSKKDPNVILRIDTFGNRCNQTGQPVFCAPISGPNVHFYGLWESFVVENEANKYRLHISRLGGGNITITSDNYGLYTFSNNRAFTTVDSNNQQNNDTNCASYGGFELGAWWHDHCGQFHLNGKYDATAGFGFNGYGFLHGGPTFFDAWYINPLGSEIKLRKKD